jgi:predicted amidohydrolase YtcJ
MEERMTERRIRRGWVLAWCAAFVVRAGVLVGQPPQPVADLVLRNARITTGDESRTEARAAAIVGGRFVAVGDDAAVGPWIGPATRVIDAGGRRVLPGLADSHLHFLRGGFRWRFELRADGVRALGDLLDRIRARVQAVPEGTWIVVGGGWHHSHLEEARMPTRDELDEVAPNHPLNVQSQYDVAQLNSAGIRAAGLGETELPPGLQIGRDARGEFNGEVRGFDGMRFIETRLPQPTLADKVEGLRGLMAHLNSLGVTSVIEAGGGGVTSEDYQALFELWRQGGMTVRVAVRYQTPDHQAALPWIVATPGRLGDEWMRILGLGEHLNSGIGGSFEEQTVEVLEDFDASVSGAAAHGLSVHQHVVETKAIANVLDVMERVNQTTPVRDLRFAIVHGEGLNRDELERMKRMGMGFAGDVRWMIFSAAHRSQNRGFIPDSPPFRTILDMGIPLTFGSDGLIAGPIRPMMWLYSAVTGRNWLGEVIRPNQRLTREEALSAVTEGAAFFSFDERWKGAIRTGMLGDLVVLDRDYFAVPEEEIAEIRPVVTVVGGRVVYEAETGEAGR